MLVWRNPRNQSLFYQIFRLFRLLYCLFMLLLKIFDDLLCLLLCRFGLVGKQVWVCLGGFAQDCIDASKFFAYLLFKELLLLL